MNLYGLSYISRKTNLINENQILDILSASQKNNSKLKISGVLIEYKNSFLQYLEGDPVLIYELFEKIKQDERHEKIFMVKFDKINERIFENWNMLYKNLNEENESKFVNKTKLTKNLDDVFEKKEFWKGVEVIEFLSNLNE